MATRKSSTSSSSSARASKSSKSSGARSASHGRASDGSSSAASRSSSSRTGRSTSAGGSASARRAKATIDHDEIRRWAEERGGKPSCVKGTGGGGDTGLLRIDFPGYSGADSLQHITWEEFFKKFDDQGLALLYQERTAAGKRSNFNKLVSRETAEVKGGGGAKAGGARKSHGRTAK